MTCDLGVGRDALWAPEAAAQVTGRVRQTSRPLVIYQPVTGLPELSRQCHGGCRALFGRRRKLSGVPTDLKVDSWNLGECCGVSCQRDKATRA